MHLQQVGKVDEHEVACFLLSTRDVEADRNDVRTLVSSRKLVFESEGVHPSHSEQNDVG